MVKRCKQNKGGIMKEILLRILTIPLIIIWLVLFCSLITPLIYWIITGNDFTEVLDEIKQIPY